MQSTGKVIEILEEVTGENANGTWVRGGFAIMLEDGKTILAFEVAGEERLKIVRGLRQGETIVVEWKPYSRKFGLNYYSSLKCYNILTTQKI